MGRYYVLQGSEVVEEPDYAKWSAWYEDSYEKVRHVASTRLQGVTVSTVFLAMNMTLSKADPPLLFETKVEGGWMDGEGERYPTLEQARAGHESWVARVTSAEAEKLPAPGWTQW